MSNKDYNNKDISDIFEPAPLDDAPLLSWDWEIATVCFIIAAIGLGILTATGVI